MKHVVSGRRRWGFGLALFLAVMWGIIPLALKDLLKALDPFTISFLRFAISAAALLPWAVAKHGAPPIGKLAGWGWGLLAVAVACLAGNYAGFHLGLARMSSSAAVVLIQTAPMFLLLGGVLLYNERYNPIQWAGLATMAAGLALFFHRDLGALFGGPSADLSGEALILLAAVLWAAYALAQKQLLAVVPGDYVLLAVYLGGAALFLPFATPAAALKLGPTRLLLLGFCGINTVLSYGAFSAALDHLEASRLSAVLATVPVIALAANLIGAHFFPAAVVLDRLDVPSLFGAILVAAGSMASSLAREKRPAASS